MTEKKKSGIGSVTMTIKDGELAEAVLKFIREWEEKKKKEDWEAAYGDDK